MGPIEWDPNGPMGDVTRSKISRCGFLISMVWIAENRTGRPTLGCPISILTAFDLSPPSENAGTRLAPIKTSPFFSNAYSIGADIQSAGFRSLILAFSDPTGTHAFTIPLFRRFPGQCSGSSGGMSCRPHARNSLRSESDRPPERFGNGVCMLTIDLHADGDSAFGNFPEECPIIFDDVALFD